MKEVRQGFDHFAGVHFLDAARDVAADFAGTIFMTPVRLSNDVEKEKSAGTCRNGAHHRGTFHSPPPPFEKAQTTDGASINQ
jgi:hypothetical protein